MENKEQLKPLLPYWLLTYFVDELMQFWLNITYSIFRQLR